LYIYFSRRCCGAVRGSRYTGASPHRPGGPPPCGRV